MRDKDSGKEGEGEGMEQGKREWRKRKGRSRGVRGRPRVGCGGRQGGGKGVFQNGNPFP